MGSEMTTEALSESISAALRELEAKAKLVTPGSATMAQTIGVLSDTAGIKRMFTTLQRRARSERAATQLVQAEAAAAQLKLENVRYEARALERELAECAAAGASAAPHLAGLGVAVPTLDTDEAHAQTIARLQDEAARRTALAEQIRTLSAQRDALRKGVCGAEASLQALPKRIRRLAAEVAPVRKLVRAAQPAAPSAPPRPEDIGLSTWGELPGPLYVLARQALAFAPGPRSAVVVVVRARRHPPLPGAQDAAAALHRPHEWSVELEVKEDDGAAKDPASVSLRFQYHPQLNIASVRVVGAEVSAGQLAELLPGDHGRESPNLENKYLLEGKFTFAAGLAGGARPFFWVNALCGLHFPPEQNEKSAMEHFRFGDVMVKIVQRVRAAHALRSQILGVKKMVIQRAKGNDPSVDKFELLDDGEVEMPGAAKAASVYRLGCHVGSVKGIMAQIVIPTSYPSPPPMLSMHRGGVFSEANIRQIERVVNNLDGVKAGDMLLKQVEKFMKCIAGAGSESFGKVGEARNVRGRGRVLLQNL